MTISGDSLEAELQALLNEDSDTRSVDFDARMAHAMAAHQALRELIEETRLEAVEPLEFRRPPAVSDDYQIERELGHGGMGVVYLARQRSLNRQVAIKVLRPGQHTFGPLIHRFLEEARNLAQLRHPHIVSIHEVGDAAGEPYFTMEFIDGETLASVLSRGAMTPSRAVELFKQVASAVQHAHRQGIIHRDLKPGNVLIDRHGQAYVTDFGLARNLGQDSHLTQSGELLGTPQYMAPEQARGQNALVGEATDIHALGLLLYEMLTGTPAFQATSPADILVKLLKEEPGDPRRIDRRIPRELETICLKCLRKDPGARYPNTAALLEDIRRYEAGEPLTARRMGLAARGIRFLRRHVRIAVAAAAAAVLVLAVSPWLFDKSFEDLVVWGDEEMATGHPDVAGRIYSRAWQRAAEAQKVGLADRMIQTCRAVDDPQTVLKLALPVLDVRPEASFGRHDLLVAQALIAKLRSQTDSGSVDVWTAMPQAELELIRQRLELAMAQGIPDDRKQEIEGTYTAVKLALNAGRPDVRYLPDYLHQLPQGSEEELKQTLDDPEAAAWNRGRAAIALARRQEAAGNSSSALALYKRAYDLMRSVYPMYSGVKLSTNGRNSPNDTPDVGECLLIRELAADLRRLDPASLPNPKSTIEFEVLGASIPPTMSVDLILELSDPAIEHPDQGLSHNLPRNVPLRQGAPVRLTILDGRYRLRTRGHHALWSSTDERTARLMQVDVENWPEQIEAQGDPIRLPPVRVRLAEEIVPTSPSNGASLTLDEAELQWQPIAGASRYQVQLMYTAETPNPTTYFFHTVSTATPSLRFSKLNDFDRSQTSANLLQGRTGGWRVDAFDAAGRRVGVMLKENRFLVVAPLSEK